MKSFLTIIASSPSSPQVTRGFQTALDLQSKGHVSVVLMQDAVLAALKDSKTADRVRQLVSNAGFAYVLADHLSMRGFSSDDLLETVRIVDYAQLVEFMMNEETSTMGVF
jgi:sulfur relay protein TusB/DsrH